MFTLYEIAHRGWAAAAPENTGAAFLAALDDDVGMVADAVECDLQITKDGQVVVMHDIALGRTSYGEGFVRDHTYDELQCFDMGSFFAPEFARQRIMRFSELLRMVGGRKFLCVELKNPGNIHRDMIDLVLKELAGYPRDSFMVESFNHPMMRKLKDRDPSIRTGLIFHDEAFMIPEHCMHAACDWVSLVWTMADRRLLAELQADGITPILWTVNEEWQFDWLMEKLEGVHGDIWIATDRPGFIGGRKRVQELSCASF